MGTDLQRDWATEGSDHYGNGGHGGTNDGAREGGGGGEILFIVDQNIVIICPGIRRGMRGVSTLENNYQT